MVLVVANPYSGAGPNRRRVDALVAALAALGAAPRVVWEPGERSAAFADAAAMGGCRAVVVAGGELPPGVPLAVLPLGSENLLARALGFGPDPAALARAVIECRHRQHDLGPATAGRRTRLLAQMHGAGLDAAVVQRVAAWRVAGTALRRVRRVSYLGPIASSLLRDAHARVRLATEAGAAHGAHCLIVNVPGYALDIRLTPAASPQDGRLDWLMLERAGVMPLMAYAWAAFRWRHLGRSDVQAGQATRLSLTAETPTPVQLDGDPWGTTPVDVEVVPRALTVIATG
jgi:diacylglycerol kinase (ATP)